MAEYPELELELEWIDQGQHYDPALCISHTDMVNEGSVWLTPRMIERLEEFLKENPPPQGESK